MIGFNESVEFTSDTNGKRLRIRKEIIDVLFEVPTSTIDGRVISAKCSITTKGNTVYMVRENYDVVMTLLGRIE